MICSQLFQSWNHSAKQRVLSPKPLPFIFATARAKRLVESIFAVCTGEESVAGVVSGGGGR